MEATLARAASHTLISSSSLSGTFGIVNDANVLAQHYAASYFVLGSLVNTWLFDGSDSWLNTARWSLGHVPLATEDVIIPDYTSLFTVTIPIRPAGSEEHRASGK